MVVNSKIDFFFVRSEIIVFDIYRDSYFKFKLERGMIDFSINYLLRFVKQKLRCRLKIYFTFSALSVTVTRVFYTCGYKNKAFMYSIYQN